jgi:diketogulonate reductase-like aldo/keto reductase
MINPPSIQLNHGGSIPAVGLGVYQSPRGEVTRETVRQALALGYRHIDTARIYGNESDVGQAIRESDVPRDQIWVTTKLWNDDQGYDRALRAFDASLSRLKLDYVDLYLLHWPVPRLRLESWRALEEIQRSGRARAIGVSNFMVHHIEELLGRASIVPAVNQIELTPFLQQREVVAACKKHSIVVQAYSPLTRGLKLDHPVVMSVARESKRTGAQVLLRWSLDRGFVTLPKSVRASRLAENLALFDFTLTEDQASRLDALEEGLVTGWDPRTQS